LKLSPKAILEQGGTRLTGHAKIFSEKIEEVKGELTAGY